MNSPALGELGSSRKNRMEFFIDVISNLKKKYNKKYPAKPDLLLWFERDLMIQCHRKNCIRTKCGSGI